MITGDLLGTVGMVLWAVPLGALAAVLTAGAIRDLFTHRSRGR